MRQQNWMLGLARALLGGLICVGTVTASPAIEGASASWLAQSDAETNWRSRLTQMLRRKPPLRESPGTTRGEICIVAPGKMFEQGNQALWSDRPLFVWSGPAAKVAVREAGKTELLWSQAAPFSPDAQFQHLRYDGPTLQAGMTYEWLIFGQVSETSPKLYQNFSVLNQAVRGPIARAWLMESLVLQQSGADSEAWTQRRIEFLLEQELSADFYEALFLAAIREQLDEGGKAIVDEVIQTFCARSSQETQT